ncbi:hypothetical protein BGY98DRAFT_508887 [Russula aff. rugulosa BPL654]|nr:hypothetical protein BGY98DRAFT_508887 [Russula aff. rugulosa BPL654]
MLSTYTSSASVLLQQSNSSKSRSSLCYLKRGGIARSSSPCSPFQLHRRNSIPIDPMHILNYWRPRKVEKHGIKRLSAARKLLESHIAELSPSNRDRAESLLNYAEDLRQIRRERSLLAQFKRARRYDKDTGEVLHIIEVSLL